MTRAQTKHPLDSLSAAEISVAVATVRASGATPEVQISFPLYMICMHYNILSLDNCNCRFGISTDFSLVSPGQR